MRSRIWLFAELLVIFVGLPLGYRFSPVRIPALPLLWLAAGYALWRQGRDSSFDRHWLWNPAPLAGHLREMLVIFFAAALVLWIGVRWLAPQLVWSFMRQYPSLWAALMVLYPLLSVYPQGIIYRAFFMHRYARLFPAGWVMLVASAAAFAFLHIIFGNLISVVLTLFGGMLFAWRYAETRSLLTSSVEHALYGCWLFTVGLAAISITGCGRNRNEDGCGLVTRRIRPSKRAPRPGSNLKTIQCRRRHDRDKKGTAGVQC